MSLDQFLDREFTKTYNCGHFATEVWSYLTGENIEQLCTGFLNGQVKAAVSFKTKITNPISPCLVLFKNRHNETHVGVYYKDKVIHLDAFDGVRYDSLAKFNSHKMSYYK